MVESSLEALPIAIKDVIVEDRIRKDYGDIDELSNSIKQLGLIQPLVLSHDLKLVVGGRRLAALKRIGVTELVHASHYIWTEEVDDLRVKAIEAEENIKRKAFTWQEEVLAKKRLFDILQEIHGVTQPGRPSRSDTLGITSGGFGVNKLASLLGESNAQTSRDLELAGLIQAIPDLAKAETKEAARRQAVLGTAVAVALAQAKLKPQQADEPRWKLFEGDFVTNVNNIEAGSIDLVITDPPYGNDAQGMGPNSKQLLTNRFDDSFKETDKLLWNLALESFKVLKDNRFAVFFFDFVLYAKFVKALQDSGFTVDLTPVIWVKNTVINTGSYSRYSHSYEPILIACKGEPKLIRPFQRNVVEIQNVITRGQQEQKFYHAQKPVELISKFILDMVPPDSTICDFCAGSGTTGVAALKLKHRVVLFEKDTGACQIIKTRLAAL